MCGLQLSRCEMAVTWTMAKCGQKEGRSQGKIQMVCRALNGDKDQVVKMILCPGFRWE
jgi:hypothetical protein